jgi:hypothetical protein
MNTQAIDLFLARLPKEEGERLLPYDDATGKPVAAPVGKLSWGRGYNLMACGSPGLFDAMDRYLVTDLDARLQHYAWYKTDPVTQSVLLDIAYNEGVEGLLHFPKMLAFLSVGDRQSAAAECAVKDPVLNSSRYGPLRDLIRSAPPFTR